MTIHVNIGEAKTRLSELVAAALRGEEVILQKAGVPKLKLVPIEIANRAEREEIARRRVQAVGAFKEEFKGFDLSLEALKADRGDPEERFRRKFGSAD
ncbi:type II toxin-antitoxin system Phd/YefM family antitoxin [Sphingorhabdus sp. 109]|jgi:prevent-host-death family protein|uniref:type II toxin-antitoxin system Phd/YefM family antitoxin n=1 Tax=Sphingorhabdus sp. 109 TaxID=2653173 RepID=UPI0012F31C77|nr:type II toxin-antitoxin system prevent-host-death family antitoxin [Sphingorhabdus sp. 109]VWX61479.1 Antitoxin [Sphingorhabdus sp. 109]